MDPATIAATALRIVAPYLAKAGEAAVQKVGEGIYSALKARFGEKPAAQEALADMEKAPDDEDAQAAVRLQLKKLLAEDEAFAAELQGLLKQAESAGAQISATAGERSLAASAGGDVTISGTTLTGDVSGTVVGGQIQGDVTIGGPRGKKKPDSNS